MRVLQIIDSLRVGGAEVLVRNMAPRLVHRGIDCQVLVLSRSDSSLEQALQRDGVKLLDTGDVELYSPRQVHRLSKLLSGFDIVHVHLFPAQLWAVLAKYLRSGSPALITTEHNTVNARRHWWFRPLDGWMYRQYALIACNSEATASELGRWCPHVKDKLRVVPNGIPLELFADAKAADLSGIGDGKIKVAFVGRFEPQKDHATLLRAMVQAPRVHLLLLGDGPLRHQLQQLARELDLFDRVSFLGFRNDVAQVLKACDIYAHSTTSDGFGIAACEAMAAGLPVVASDVPGLAQVVEGAGVLIPVGDHDGMAHELNALADSTEKRTCMSEASRRRARDFSIDRTVEGYAELYESVLRDSARQKLQA